MSHIDLLLLWLWDSSLYLLLASSAPQADIRSSLSLITAQLLSVCRANSAGDKPNTAYRAKFSAHSTFGLSKIFDPIFTTKGRGQDSGHRVTRREDLSSEAVHDRETIENFGCGVERGMSGRNSSDSARNQSSRSCPNSRPRASKYP
jgi:hypothetical protein